jgi:hypothetical protein
MKREREKKRTRLLSGVQIPDPGGHFEGSICRNERILIRRESRGERTSKDLFSASMRMMVSMRGCNVSSRNS